MAAPFSPTTTVRSVLQPKLNPPKALLTVQDSYFRVSGSAKCSVNVSSLSASVPYSSLGALKLSGKPIATDFHKRKGVIRHATLEEIEAEKSLIQEDVKERMEKTIDSIRTNFNSIRTGRANPSMLDKVVVEYYGSPVNIKSIAQITSPDASSLLVQPYDKSSLKIIEKAIINSGLGLTPSNDGDVIRMTVPQLTADRRKEMAKDVVKQAEEGKVAIRNIRRDAVKACDKLKKEKKLSEDNVNDLTSDLQKLTDEYMKKIDAITKEKEKEVLTV